MPQQPRTWQFGLADPFVILGLAAVLLGGDASMHGMLHRLLTPAGAYGYLAIGLLLVACWLGPKGCIDRRRAARKKEPRLAVAARLKPFRHSAVPDVSVLGAQPRRALDGRRLPKSSRLRKSRDRL